jgi:hypothetical protein
MTMGAAKTPAIVALNTRGVKGATKGFAVSFRAWPWDIDTYFHVNNAMYARVAEMARWRMVCLHPHAYFFCSSSCS